MRKVLVFGSFDVLHLGHLYFLKQAKKYGDHLMVVIARDSSIKRLKKHPPHKNEEERLGEVRECKLVNKAVLGYKDNPYRIIKELSPDVICLGYDQKFFTENLAGELKKMGLKTKIYRMGAYKPHILHSVILNNRLHNGRKTDFNKRDRNQLQGSRKRPCCFNFTRMGV